MLRSNSKQLVYENVCMITSLPTKRICAISQSQQTWRRKPAGMESWKLHHYVIAVCDVRSGRVQFDCVRFDNDSLPGYCFTYVSTANSGAVAEHSSLCLPTVYQPGTLHPQQITSFVRRSSFTYHIT